MTPKGALRYSSGVLKVRGAVLGSMVVGMWLGLSGTLAHAAEPQRKPTPGWVSPVAVDYDEQSPAESNGDSFTLLRDSRVRLRGSHYERYERRVRRALSRSGVERMAELFVGYGPDYERLEIHRIQLYRKGEVLDQTQSARVRLVADESELDQRIYRGEVSAFIVLTDVRAGDVIDYSYSIIGDDPILGGHFAGAFSLGSSEPVRQLRVQIFGEGPRFPLLTAHLGPASSPAPEPLPAGGWELRNVPAEAAEDRVPAAVRSSVLQITDFASWQEVAAWGARLYPLLPPSPEVVQQAARLVGDVTDPEEAALRILRFVQDDVRYLAISTEGHALRPHAPRTVLAQRFGDCKDKAYLLMHLLAARGISARPVLVNSDWRASVASYAPSPYAFDHVILQVDVGGATRYLDATHAHQGGTLRTQVPPSYGLGLVLSPESTALTPIETPPLAGPGKRSLTKLVLTPEGAAALDVTTELEGAWADDMRVQLANDSRDTIAERYANYYQTAFADVTVAAPLEVEDARRENRVVIRERYQVPQFWRDGERSLYPDSVESYLRAPRVVRRRLALELEHPTWVEETFRLALPFSTTTEPRHETSEDDSFHFDRDIRQVGGELVATFSYRSSRAEVSTSALSTHLAALQRARELAVVFVTNEQGESTAATHPPPDDASSMVWVWLVGTVALGFLGGTSARFFRARRRREFSGRQRAERGESPASFAEAAHRAEAETALVRRACTCGQRLEEEPVVWSSLRYQDELLHAARVDCPTCGEPLRRYFKLAEE